MIGENYLMMYPKWRPRSACADLLCSTWASIRQNPQLDGTSKDSDQPSMARVFIHPSLDSPEAVEGTCNQRRLWSDCADAQADLSLSGRTSLIVGFVVCWLTLYFTVSTTLVNGHCGLWSDCINMQAHLCPLFSAYAIRAVFSQWCLIFFWE